MGALAALIPSILSAVTSVFGGVTAEQTQKLSDALTLALSDEKLQELQIQLDTAEAGSESLFVAGWRPWIGWGLGTCVVLIAAVEVLNYFLVCVGHVQAPLPTMDSNLLYLLSSMLGINMGARSFDKLQITNLKKTKLKQGSQNG